MTLLRGHGISVDLARGWEGRIERRVAPSLPGSASRVDAGAGRHQNVVDAGIDDYPGDATADGTAYPVTHLANFALPADRGDFGSGAVDLMGPDHMLVALVEYGSDSAGTALFAARGMPEPQPWEFHPNALQRRIAGQLGYQRFFTENGRPFCLYLVTGSARGTRALLRQVEPMLTGIRIEPR